MCLVYSPWDPPRLQLVGDVHVPGPDVELPLPETQHAAQHRARVDPDAHVDVVFRARSYVSGRKTQFQILRSSPTIGRIQEALTGRTDGTTGHLDMLERKVQYVG